MMSTTVVMPAPGGGGGEETMFTDGIRENGVVTYKKGEVQAQGTTVEVCEVVASPPPPTATQRALATSELLELILLHVDMQTLLVAAQRASRTWHDTIAASPALQRRLFFLPERPWRHTDDGAPTDDDNDRRYEAEARRVDNPLLKAHFPPFFDDAVDPLRLVPSAAGEVTLENALWELDEELEVPCAKLTLGKLPLHRSPCCGGNCDDDEDDDGGPYRREGASWKRMLTSQPPVTCVGFLRHPRTRDDPEMQLFEPPPEPSCSSVSASPDDGHSTSSLPPSSSSSSSSSSRSSSSSSSSGAAHHGLRMAHLYAEVLTRVRWADADACKFQVLAHAQALPRDEFVRRATLPRPWSAVLGDEDASGPGAAAASTAAGDGRSKAAGRAALRAMHDAGAQVVILSYCSGGGSFVVDDGAWDREFDFWRACNPGK
ncbi:cytochrome P450 [Purpureocillium lavendulum]|uniref:Cytochrome P450 n=1 Tax=Purpureocillium lavendulum TaxID=1247861 RepID=A0AB34G1S8_9HYPO|nr:cytochrome P450 [Purpureocillium lavendulum]